MIPPSPPIPPPTAIRPTKISSPTKSPTRHWRLQRRARGVLKLMLAVFPTMVQLRAFAARCGCAGEGSRPPQLAASSQALARPVPAAGCWPLLPSVARFEFASGPFLFGHTMKPPNGLRVVADYHTPPE